MTTNHIHGIQGKSLTSSRYDATDHIPITCSLVFWCIMAGKIQLRRLNHTLKKIPINLSS